MAMKASRAFGFLLAWALMPLLSGCFTAGVAHNTVREKSDWFAPTSIYRSKADGSLAVEGTLTKAGESNGVVAYLIVPQKVLVAAHLETKGDVSMGDISSLSPQVRRELHLQKTLDADYEKIGDVLKGDGSMSVSWAVCRCT